MTKTWDERRDAELHQPFNEDSPPVVLKDFHDAIDALDNPPQMPQRWVVVDPWDGVYTSAADYDDLIAGLGDHATVEGDDVYFCPCYGVHESGCDGAGHPGKACGYHCALPCRCPPDCKGQCWEDEIPDGYLQRIVALHDTVVPVIRDNQVGWAAATWHDHSPSPGGMLELPKVRQHPSGISVWACGEWKCGVVIEDGDIDVAAVIDDDVDDDTRAAIIEAWAARGESDRARYVEAAAAWPYD